MREIKIQIPDDCLECKWMDDWFGDMTCKLFNQKLFKSKLQKIEVIRCEECIKAEIKE